LLESKDVELQSAERIIDSLERILAMNGGDPAMKTGAKGQGVGNENPLNISEDLGYGSPQRTVSFSTLPPQFSDDPLVVRQRTTSLSRSSSIPSKSNTADGNSADTSAYARAAAAYVAATQTAASVSANDAAMKAGLGDAQPASAVLNVRYVGRFGPKNEIARERCWIPHLLLI
jgi:hypothetical protein